MYKKIALFLITFLSFNLAAMDYKLKKIGTLSVVNKSDKNISITVSAREFLQVRRLISKVALAPNEGFRELKMFSDYDVTLGWKKGVICYCRPFIGNLKVVSDGTGGFELTDNGVMSSIKEEGESKG